MDALARVAQAHEHVACAGVLVDAKSARAEGFYERYSFKALDRDAAYPRRLFLSIDTLRTAL